MNETIIKLLQKIINDDVASVELSIPDEPAFGHFSTNIAMRLAKAQNKKPTVLAEELALQLQREAPEGFFEKVEAAAPGFVNMWVSKKSIQEEFRKISEDSERYGVGDSMESKTVMVEFTDPNPFKLFHIGHLMSNAIGESIGRLYEAAGAKVIRANYQGDVGLHVAKAVWGLMQNEEAMPSESAYLLTKIEYLSRAYASGTKAYEKQEEAKTAINDINGKIYSRSDERINKIYDLGRTWSLDYFDTVYRRLGTIFDHFFFESEMAQEGIDIVRAYSDVFVESQGAIIFPGEQYGLHTRVFINAKGLPTYEAKELGLNKKKFELYPLDLSIIITGNEIVDYFKVLLKAMECTLPEVAKKTRHISHGMMRLPTGKMSSRTGDVITADALLDQTTAKLREYVSPRTTLDPVEQEFALETMAIGAIKYSILKQGPGQDIVFDFEKSLSVEGDSGPYIEYAYARLESILRKAQIPDHKIQDAATNFLESDIELAVMRKLFEFPRIVARAAEFNNPSVVATYTYKLAAAANKFYETTPILKDEDSARRDARLLLVATVASTLRSGLGLLGIKALEKI